MMKPDERAFLAAIVEAHRGPYRKPEGIIADMGRRADEIADDLGMHPKRAYYILLKWSDRRIDPRDARLTIWEYGVSVGGGWFTPEGFRWAQEQLKEPANRG